MYWILPFRLDDRVHEERYRFFVDVVQKRGIAFDVVGQETYQICGNQVRVGDGAGTGAGAGTGDGDGDGGTTLIIGGGSQK
jgi:hypothetical protein